MSHHHTRSGKDHHDLEERKTPIKKPADDYMLSQDSIKAFALEAEKETVEEREKLHAMELNRKEFAKRLRET